MADEVYRGASEIVRLLNRAIDEQTDPKKKAHLKAALKHAHAAEDVIAKALELEARKEA